MQLGFYRSVIRYISRRALRVILLGIFASSVALFAFSQLLDLPIPRSVPAIYAVLATISVGGARFLLQLLFLHQQDQQKTRVIVYGAGESGRQLLNALQHGREYAPVALVDDSVALQGTDIGGYRVHSPNSLEQLVSNRKAQMILLAVPSASRTARKAILERLEPLPVHIQTIPGIADLVSGDAQINEFREVPIEDLLGRDPVPPRVELMDANIREKAVLVTGAGGSIGSELCRQIIQYRPAKVVLFDVSEIALYSIDMELKALAAELNVEIIPVLGSIQDFSRVENTLTFFNIDTVYHAAAYKHVPLVEENVIEGLRNNIFGTLNVARAAASCGIENFILISTDKAVRPTNIMGASKRMAELICQALAERTQTRFSMVRFGNVLGSSGSVIPRFRQQIEAGGPITVTHPEITRYFMTIHEAAQLVIQAGAMAKGGDVFVLDMGEPVRIVDLAKRMVKLSGLTPYFPNSADKDAGGDIPIVFTGLRHGEKLYEELLIDNTTTRTDHPRILTAKERSMSWPDLQRLLDQLSARFADNDINSIRAILRSAPTGYAPSSDIADVLWSKDLLKPAQDQDITVESVSLKGGISSVPLAAPLQAKN
uniref:polysaccharide biosynthesis protein n=1 Tax=Chelativorans sp. YIM 93263 TaxID=2906648 RepID=UPI002378B6CB|nr:nucleoside-diphosphate sugar epimerase/dehydratase [Chelativorans sp. YIM 93263]